MLIVTIAALVMAASLGWFAYRLLREEQRRSDARVALLTAALDAEPAAAVAAARSVPERPAPTLPSIVMLEDGGRSMRAFASEHRAAPLGVDTRDEPDALRSPQREEVAYALGEDVEADAPARSAGLFAEVPEARPADARGFIAVAGLLLVGILAIGYAWFGSSPGDAAETSGASQAPIAAPAATGTHSGPVVGTPAATAAAVPVTSGGGVPLELLSLRHEQQKNTLVIRGVVRNPVSGSDRVGVLARVTLLDAAGVPLGDASASVDTPRLRPGTETAFAVQLPSREAVRRYRVTFRTPEGALVAHVDRRG